MNELSEKIRAEIAARGIIPFARFMELALYCPLCGYYEQEADNIGRRGDYYTNVSVGSLFGELLAFQFAEWLGELRVPPSGGTPQSDRPKAELRTEPPVLQLVEAGAHDGRLAVDILTWLQRQRPELFKRLEYWIIEPSARRQQRQKETLRAFLPGVKWLAELPAATPGEPCPTICGVIFSNELLDAMPVHRLGWDAKVREWFEWGVALSQDQFVWARMPDPVHDPRLAVHLPPELLDVLPDGFSAEVCPTAVDWWQQAARVLARGKLLTIDYGLTAAEFITPERRDGTLRAYHRHHYGSDVLANVGEQDLTTHVNFTALEIAGEAEDLRTEALVAQEQWLTCIAEKAWKNAAAFGEWTAARTRQFQTLTHPQHLGRPFRVLIQSR